MEQLFTRNDLTDIAGIVKHFEQQTSCELVVRITHDRVISDDAAQIEFTRLGLNRHEGRLGLLLYVNLFQHRFVILSGHSIVDKLGGDWADKHAEMLSDRFRKYRFGFGLHDIVSRMANELKLHFPARRR